MTRAPTGLPAVLYEVEACPGQPRDPATGWEGAGFRVVAVTGDVRRPMLVRYRRKQHARAEANRLRERDLLLLGRVTR